MILPGFHGFDNTEITELSLSLQKFLQMKHFKKFLTPYLTKLKLTLNPEGAQGALYCFLIDLLSPRRGIEPRSPT